MFAIKPLVGCVLTFSMAIVFAGCDSSSSSKGGGASMDQMAGAVDAQKSAKAKADQDAAAAKAAADKQASEPAQSTAPVEQEKKKVGSRGKPEVGGYFGAIVGARRHVMNVVDSLAWIQGVRNFQGEEGRNPKDTVEFMKVVVPKYELQLPKIEDDEEFLYDPKGESDGNFGQLYVVKKAAAPESSPPTPAK